MARTKTIVRTTKNKFRSVSPGKSPVNRLVGRKTVVEPKKSLKKIRRFRPGAVTLREIKRI